MSYKKVILLDLDGVLNTYNGNYNDDYIEPINKGALKLIKELAKNYKIKIFTSRNLLLASEWVIKNNLKKYIYDVTNIKEPSFLIIDDRCIKFDGDYKKLIENINSFKVWYKK